MTNVRSCATDSMASFMTCSFLPSRLEVDSSRRRTAGSALTPPEPLIGESHTKLRQVRPDAPCPGATSTPPKRAEGRDGTHPLNRLGLPPMCCKRTSSAYRGQFSMSS